MRADTPASSAPLFRAVSTGCRGGSRHFSRKRWDNPAPNRNSRMNAPPQEIFKAYDIRGVVGKSLTVEGVRLIGQALGSELLDRTRGGRAEIAVGRDGRLSGPDLASALMDGIRASGVD